MALCSSSGTAVCGRCDNCITSGKKTVITHYDVKEAIASLDTQLSSRLTLAQCVDVIKRSAFPFTAIDSMRLMSQMLIKGVLVEKEERTSKDKPYVAVYLRKTDIPMCMFNVPPYFYGTCFRLLHERYIGCQVMQVTRSNIFRKYTEELICIYNNNTSLLTPSYNLAKIKQVSDCFAIMNS